MENNYYNEIKNELINNEVYKRVKDYSKRLTKELGKRYTFTALSRMRQFYLLSEKVATMSQQLSWSHYVELISFNDINEINYYINTTEKYNLSVRQLREKIIRSVQNKKIIKIYCFIPKNIVKLT